MPMFLNYFRQIYKQKVLGAISSWHGMKQNEKRLMYNREYLINRLFDWKLFDIKEGNVQAHLGKGDNELEVQ